MSKKSATINGKEKYVRILIRRKALGTSAECAERLIKAGVSPSTADLSVSRQSQRFMTDHSLHAKYPAEYAPAWSPLKMLELMPLSLETDDGQEARLAVFPYGTRAERKYQIAYIVGDFAVLSTEGFFFEAACEMLEQLNKIK